MHYKTIYFIQFVIHSIFTEAFHSWSVIKWNNKKPAAFSDSATNARRFSQRGKKQVHICLPKYINWERGDLVANAVSEWLPNLHVEHLLQTRLTDS
jgi:hypothetical protein